ncbi:unnamed protein product [Thelazia callipaeda]|uniref:Dol-P-Glc:Glc(2)Man(9)GlcNAc(2)-PP-Dol alpha-1,2-glucosyltransferase n=1 Tax=Thelazia callipaeda TaxID=103827 RepID=A0A0N5CY94_THECL|nr:unnamed protein product [Thelazia callipaeda]
MDSQIVCSIFGACVIIEFQHFAVLKFAYGICPRNEIIYVYLILEIWLIGSFLGLLHSFLVRYIYRIVPEPYMDEIFHVYQTRNFCAFNFTWDPKITTPPALYILSVPIFCEHERYTNSALIPFSFVGCMQFQKLFSRHKFGTRLQIFKCTVTSITVLLLPVLFHSSLLYYTDLLSLTTLVWAASLPPGILSSLIFLVSVCTRQTNIIWAAVYGSFHLFALLEKQCKHGLSFSFWSLLLLPIGFVIFFVFNNNSIVLGDRSAHQPVPHFMQFFYFLVFHCFSSAPLLLCRSKTYHCIKENILHPVKSLILLLLISCCVYFFTFQHQYLLADNRHFTFYIWRRWFLRHPCCKYIAVIFYILALKLFIQIIDHIPKLLAVLYILGTAAVLVPVNLLEPRYFIVPYIFWRLSYPERRISVIIFELIYAVLINTLVLYMFLFRPFEWSHLPNVKQRFMW